MNLKSLLLALALFLTSQAQAATLQFSIDGAITSAISGNILGLAVGDTITASGQFDDSLLNIEIAGGVETGISWLNFDSAFNNMQITVGNANYTDIMAEFGGAQMLFDNGIFNGINYESLDSSFDSWGYADLGVQDDFNAFFDDNSQTYDVGGYWNVNTYTTSAVPLPAAVWLFGTGLLSLGVFSRRKQGL